MNDHNKKNPKNNPHNKQRHCPKRCYSSKGKRSTAARASGHSPRERWPNSPTQSEHKRCDNIVGSGGNDPRQVWTASPQCQAERGSQRTSEARQYQGKRLLTQRATAVWISCLAMSLDKGTDSLDSALGFWYVWKHMPDMDESIFHFQCDLNTCSLSLFSESCTIGQEHFSRPNLNQ